MAKEAITLAGNTIQPGEKGFGYLYVGRLAAGTEVRVPSRGSFSPITCRCSYFSMLSVPYPLWPRLVPSNSLQHPSP